MQVIVCPSCKDVLAVRREENRTCVCGASGHKDSTVIGDGLAVRIKVEVNRTSAIIETERA